MRMCAKRCVGFHWPKVEETGTAREKILSRLLYDLALWVASYISETVCRMRQPCCCMGFLIASVAILSVCFFIFF